jgi:hypothetical protein
MKYYTDEELIQRIENYGEELAYSDGSLIDPMWLAEKIRERFKQKDQQREYIAKRCDIAAEHMGHTLISELMEERY